MSDATHKPDCAVVVNARHACSCGAADNRFRLVRNCLGHAAAIAVGEFRIMQLATGAERNERFAALVVDVLNAAADYGSGVWDADALVYEANKALLAAAREGGAK